MKNEKELKTAFWVTCTFIMVLMVAVASGCEW